MKISTFLILCCLFCLSAVKAQVPEWKRSFPVEELVAVSTDGQGNIYVSSRDGEIKKYTSEGILLSTFSPQSAGLFSILDASSALQVKAFNENSQTIVFLDRFLNQTASFQLPQDRFNYISALCWSSGNTTWLADAAELQLIRWRTDTREVLSTLNLNQYVTDSRFEISSLKEYQHKLYLFSPDRLYVFDQLGNYEKQLTVPSWRSIAFSENEMLLLGKDFLSFIHLYSSKERTMSLPAGSRYEHVAFSKGEIYLFSAQEAHVYRITP